MSITSKTTFVESVRKNVDRGLRTADCGLRTAVYGLGIKHRLSLKNCCTDPGQYKMRTADYGLGIKRGLSLKCGLSLKIAVLTHKFQKMLLVQFSPALLSSRRPNLASPGVYRFKSRFESNANKRKHCKFKVLL